MCKSSWHDETLDLHLDGDALFREPESEEEVHQRVRPLPYPTLDRPLGQDHEAEADVLYIVEDHVRALSQISFLTKEHESLHALTVDKTKKLEEEMEKYENVGKLLQVENDSLHNKKSQKSPFNTKMMTLTLA